MMSTLLMEGAALAAPQVVLRSGRGFWIKSQQRFAIIGLSAAYLRGVPQLRFKLSAPHPTHSPAHSNHIIMAWPCTPRDPFSKRQIDGTLQFDCTVWLQGTRQGWPAPRARHSKDEGRCQCRAPSLALQLAVRSRTLVAPIRRLVASGFAKAWVRWLQARRQVVAKCD